MPLLGREKVQAMTEAAYLRINNNVRGVYLAGLTDVAFGTPADTGITRNSWFLSVGTPSGSISTSKNKTGLASIRQLRQMPKSVLNKKVFYTNNRPNIGVLEYGGFPSPVKKGSYIKKTKSYQILSINGFSKQAPSGWVRVALAAMQNKIRSL